MLEESLTGPALVVRGMRAEEGVGPGATLFLFASWFFEF